MACTLYTSIGPNPRFVRMTAHELGIPLDLIQVDLVGGENRRPPFLKLNPSGELPLLQTPDGQLIAETAAICEYLCEISSGDSLIGNTPEARAETRMWMRRVDLRYVQPMTCAFRFGPALSFFAKRVHCIPAAAADYTEITREGEQWLSDFWGDGPFIAGDRFSLADIMLFCFMHFAGRRAGLPVKPDTPLAHWMDRMSERPSAQATEAATYGL